jgi:DNA polymerase III sliding clamp (beta) subunit (PCNA family)
MIEGQFPDYQRIIPADARARSRVSTTDFLRATRGRLRSRQRTQPEHRCGRPRHQITFDGGNLRDALEAIHTPEVLLQITGPSSPVIIEPAGEPNGIRHLQVIMPLHVATDFTTQYV